MCIVHTLTLKSYKQFDDIVKIYFKVDSTRLEILMSCVV